MEFLVVLNCDCDQIQTAISARLDGEDNRSGLADDVIDAHIAGCASCSAFLEQAAQVKRTLNFSIPEHDFVTPDLSDVILAGVESQWHKNTSSQVLSRVLSRLLLCISGGLWFLMAFLILAQSQVTQQQEISDIDVAAQEFTAMAFHLAALRCSLGIGLLFSAWKPQLSAGIAPVFFALWMFSFGVYAKDIVLGELAVNQFLYLALLLLSVVAILWAWLSVRGLSLIGQFRAALSAKPSD
ncbi:hypothetical protein FQV43_03015 [Corynebacterium sp. sy039]|nr:hypothetical protein FQV43_03015 [Corynebacterium sp. sy039]